MTSAKDTVEYLKNNLNTKNVLSMFYSGSIPDNLIPQSDLDIYIIAKNAKEQELLNNLKEIMDKFQKNHTTIKYSFYRGPIKYKHKGLVHLFVYTEKELDKKFRYAYTSENTPVIKSHLKDNHIIYGKNLTEIVRNVNLDETTDTDANKRWKEKYTKLLKNNKIQHSCWKKKDDNWILTFHKKTPSQFLRTYLIKYYEKHLS